MYTALILACGVDLTSCQSFMYPLPLPDEETCLSTLAEGIDTLESQGLYIRDYTCHQWTTET